MKADFIIIHRWKFQPRSFSFITFSSTPSNLEADLPLESFIIFPSEYYFCLLSFLHCILFFQLSFCVPLQCSFQHLSVRFVIRSDTVLTVSSLIQFSIHCKHECVAKGCKMVFTVKSTWKQRIRDVLETLFLLKNESTKFKETWGNYRIPGGF